MTVLGATSALELRQQIDTAPMSRAQIVAVAITFLLSALDGYDVLSATFAAPAIRAEWGLGSAALGIILAAGLAGMAIGALVLAPLADNIGRKTMVIVSLVLMAIGMLGCAFSPSIAWLSAMRVVAGLGIGACVAVINPVAAEFANARRRPLTVAIMAIGFPFGGVVGGLIASVLLQEFGWESVFLAGFFGSLIMLPLVIWLLPESFGYLLARPRSNGIERLNKVLARCALPAVAKLEYAGETRVGYAAAFSSEVRFATIWLTTVNVLFVLAVYYLLSWLPQLVADAGFTPATASLASVAANSAGVIGGLALGFVAQRGNLKALVAIGLLGFAAATALLGIVTPSFGLLLFAAAVCGFFLFGGATGLYAAIAIAFPDSARATGTGFVTGMGRIASAVSPAAAGWLFATGLTRAEVSITFALSSGVAGLVLLWGWKRVHT